MTATVEAHLTGTEEVATTRYGDSSTGRKFVTVQVRQPGTTTRAGAYRGASAVMLYADVESLNTVQSLIRALEAAMGYLMLDPVQGPVYQPEPVALSPGVS